MYPEFPRFHAGFCGALGGFDALPSVGSFMLRQTAAQPANPSFPWKDPATTRFATIDLSRPNEQLPGSGSVPAYDLRQDNRDLCLKVGTFGGFLGSATSNTVRVPREAITHALSEGIKPLPPLVPIALGWPTIK
jgi:hypothetical protein